MNKKNKAKYKGPKPLTFLSKARQGQGFSNPSPVTHTLGERGRERAPTDGKLGAGDDSGAPASQAPADPHDTTTERGRWSEREGEQKGFEKRRPTLVTVAVEAGDQAAVEPESGNHQ